MLAVSWLDLLSKQAVLKPEGTARSRILGQHNRLSEKVKRRMHSFGRPQRDGRPAWDAALFTRINSGIRDVFNWETPDPSSGGCRPLPDLNRKRLLRVCPDQLLDLLLRQTSLPKGRQELVEQRVVGADRAAPGLTHMVPAGVLGDKRLDPKNLALSSLNGRATLPSNSSACREHSAGAWKTNSCRGGDIRAPAPCGSPSAGRRPPGRGRTRCTARAGD